MAQPTGCEIDVPFYLYRGHSVVPLFRLWLRVDGGEKRQLYHGFRHCLPLEPGAHEIEIWYGDAWSGGKARDVVQIEAGRVQRVQYHAPFIFLPNPGFLTAERARATLGPEAWSATRAGRFDEAAVAPCNPALLGPGLLPIGGGRWSESPRLWRGIRRAQHEPMRNAFILVTWFGAFWGSFLWLLRALWIGGASVAGVALFPTVLTLAWALTPVVPEEGRAVRGKKYAALAFGFALTFLQIGGIAQGWGLPSHAERVLEERLAESAGKQEAIALNEEAQRLAARGDLEAAVARLARARDLSPGDLEIRLSLAHGYARLARRDDAIVEVIHAFDDWPQGAARELARRPVLVRAVWERDSFRALRQLHPEIDKMLETYGFGEEWEFVPETFAL